MAERMNQLRFTNREVEVLNDLVNQELEGLAEHDLGHEVDPALDSLADKVTRALAYVREMGTDG